MWDLVAGTAYHLNQVPRWIWESFHLFLDDDDDICCRHQLCVSLDPLSSSLLEVVINNSNGSGACVFLLLNRERKLLIAFAPPSTPSSIGSLSLSSLELFDWQVNPRRLSSTTTTRVFDHTCIFLHLRRKEIPVGAGFAFRWWHSSTHPTSTNFESSIQAFFLSSLMDHHHHPSYYFVRIMIRTNKSTWQTTRTGRIISLRAACVAKATLISQAVIV